MVWAPMVEHLAAGAAGVLGGGVEQHARRGGRGWGCRGKCSPPIVTSPRGRRGQPDHDAHGGGLAGAVGAEEAGDRARLAHEADVVDGGEARRTPGESFDLDHGAQPAAAPPAGDIGPRQGVGRDQSRGSGATRRRCRPRPVVGLAWRAWTAPPPTPYQPPLTPLGHAWRLVGMLAISRRSPGADRAAGRTGTTAPGCWPRRACCGAGRATCWSAGGAAGRWRSRW